MNNIPLKKYGTCIAMETLTGANSKRAYLTFRYPRKGHTDTLDSSHFFIEVDARVAARDILGLDEKTELTKAHWKKLWGEANPSTSLGANKRKRQSKLIRPQ
jgi:hypothetical protein